MGTASPSRVEQARTRTVHIGDDEVPFADVVPAQARAQAEELKSAGTWGPLQRVAKVAMAWGELANVIEKSGAEKVGDLDDEEVVTWAERVWVISPEGGLI